MLYPRSHPAPMETCGALAEYDEAAGKLTLWCTTQAPHAHRTFYALLTGIAEHRIRVISPDVGGGFGNKVPVYPGYVCAVVGAIITGRPVKWMEDRSENLMSTGFARDYRMRGAIAATGTGRILAVRADVIADHGAFNAAAQPTQFPAGFFHVFTGSYDLEAAHCRVRGGVHEQGAGGSRLLVLVPHHRGGLPGRAAGRLPGPRARRRPRRAAAGESDQGRAVPVRVEDRVGLRLRRLRADAAQGARQRRLRRASTRAGGATVPGRADGDRRRVLHRGGRRRPSPAHGHPRTGDERRRRPARPSDRQGAAGDQRPDPGSGARDDVRADRRRGTGDPTGGCRRCPRRHRHDAVRARHLRLTFDAGQRRGDRAGRAQGTRPRADRGGDDARGRAGGPGVDQGALVRPRRPRAGRDDPGDRDGGSRAGRSPGGRRERARRGERLRPAEPDLSIRRLRVRGRHRSWDGKGAGAAVRGRRRLRRADQSRRSSRVRSTAASRTASGWR